MLRVLVDSGSSIKMSEQDKLNVEIIPLRYLMGETEYRDGLDETIDEFYEMLIGKVFFRKRPFPTWMNWKPRLTAMLMTETT